MITKCVRVRDTRPIENICGITGTYELNRLLIAPVDHVTGVREIFEIEIGAIVYEPRIAVREQCIICTHHFLLRIRDRTDRELRFGMSKP